MLKDMEIKYCIVWLKFYKIHVDYFMALYSHLPLPFYPPVSNASVLLLFSFLYFVAFV